MTCLPEIRSAAFYRVALPPHVSAVTGTDFSSLRLRNGQGGEQPYLIEAFPAARARQLSMPAARIAVPVAGFSQVDSGDKRSYLRIRFDEAYPLDGLRLRFRGPRFYARVIRMPEALPDWRGSIRQGQDAVIDAKLRARELLLVVDNDDNPPLRLSVVQAEQQAYYLTAWLEPGSYRLEYGDERLVPPRYDIAVLADSLSGIRLPFLAAGPVEPVSSAPAPAHEAAQPEKVQEPAPARAVLIWTIIGGILIALVFATRALARRIGPEQDET